MNKVYIHSKNSVKRIIMIFILSLIPIILYGIYKNGLLIYQKDLINILYIFKLLYLIILSVLIYFIIHVIWKKKQLWSIEILIPFIIPLFMPPLVNILLYLIGFILGFTLINVIPNKFNYNKLTLIYLLIMIILLIFKNTSYLNLLEQNEIYSFNIWDLLWGRNIGGLATTNIILALFIIVINSVFSSYKKNIAIIAIFSFCLLTLFINSFNVTSIINGNAIISFILIATDLPSSPVTKNGMIICGLLIGVLSSILCRYGLYYEGAIISIFIISILYPLLSKDLKNDKIMSILKNKRNIKKEIS